MEFAAARLSSSSVQIAVGASINVDMMKEHCNLHIVMPLLVKVNVSDFPSIIRLHKNETI